MGLCPECLLKAGFSTGTSVADPTAAEPRRAFIPPTLAELAPHFPQLQIAACIGQGGMGAVYRARQPSLDRIVALKILRPRPGEDSGFTERFAREARALARLSHPHIVAVHDFGQAGGYHYLIMEFVDGVNLRHLLNAGRVGAKEALAIVPQICEALQFAHDQGVVHRDIKPENILLGKDGVVKIADFGLAKIVGGAMPGANLTGAGEVMGTPHYMAPEQVERPREVDHRADIYSLGVVFYQMLTGELPLGRFGPPSRKVQIDVRLDEVVLRALEKEPELRYQQARTLKSEIETIVTGVSPVPARAISGGGVPPARRQRLRVSIRGPLVGLREGRRAVNWPVLVVRGLLALGFVLAYSALLAVAAGWQAGGLNRGFLSAAVGAVVIALAAMVRIIRGLTTPLDQLPDLDHPVTAPPDTTSPAAKRRSRARRAFGLVAGAALLLIPLVWLVVRQGANGPLPDSAVTGIVTDAATNRPIAGARVADTIYNTGPGQAPQEAWTDFQGHYVLRTWYEEHTIAASAPGYEAKVATILTKVFGREREVRMDFQLKPTSKGAAAGAGSPLPGFDASDGNREILRLRLQQARGALAHLPQFGVQKRFFRGFSGPASL